MTEMTYGLMQGRYPAIVRSYDQARRTCRVEIPGLTDGADTLPEAEIEYPVGDKAAHGQYPTEIEILPGDTVWIAFIGGDPRYPIIRVPETRRRGTRSTGVATTTKTTNSSATGSFGSWSGTRSFSSIPTRSRGRLRRP